VTFSRVKIPKNRPRFVRMGEETRFVPMEQLISGNLDRLFPNVEILEVSTFRVTRNAEVRREEEVAEDLIDMVEEVLEERRFAGLVRLEVEADTSDRILDVLTSELGVDDREVIALPAPLDFSDLFELLDVQRPDLQYPEWTPQPHPNLVRRRGDEPRPIFDQIRQRDVLVHHPYHAFSDTVGRFIDEAAHDPDVLLVGVRVLPAGEAIARGEFVPIDRRVFQGQGLGQPGPDVGASTLGRGRVDRDVLHEHTQRATAKIFVGPVAPRRLSDRRTDDDPWESGR
jgi:polyphosphate kinase